MCIGVQTTRCVHRRWVCCGAQLQSAMQQLQAANVPEAGLQEFEAQWTARPEAGQGAAPRAPATWTYCSPRGEEVQGVAGLIKVFTSRLLGARTCVRPACCARRRLPSAVPLHLLGARLHDVGWLCSTGSGGRLFDAVRGVLVEAG